MEVSVPRCSCPTAVFLCEILKIRVWQLCLFFSFNLKILEKYTIGLNLKCQQIQQCLDMWIVPLCD